MKQQVTHCDVLPTPLISDHDAPYICLNVRVPWFVPRFKMIRNERCFKVLMSQKKIFGIWVEDKKLVNRFFNIFRFSLFIREICGSKPWKIVEKLAKNCRAREKTGKGSGATAVWRSLRNGSSNSHVKEY
jgi:hypothetical protein